jgi:hypothetical protein
MILLPIFFGFAFGTMRSIKWLLPMPALCVGIGLVVEVTGAPTDQPGLAFYLAGLSAAASLAAGIIGYIVATLIHRWRS